MIDTATTWRARATDTRRPTSDEWAALFDFDVPLWVVENPAGPAFFDKEPECPWHAYLPAIRPERLGDATFREDYGLRYAYLAGAMANGIGSVEVVEAMGFAGMLGFFGAAGLARAQVARAIDQLETKRIPFGFNLIHSPHDPRLEETIADLYIRRGVRIVEASAYLGLTLPIVRYRLHGIRSGSGGSIDTPNHVIAKVSRNEVAAQFLSPAPDRFISELVSRGELTSEQATLARRIPIASDITAEADSGGHTDNRPLVTLLPALIALRDRIQGQMHYARVPRVGAAGGISTPASVAAAFALGAAYVLTGSINQACVESGSSDVVRKMLAEAGPADVIMAPAADMFEMGVKVQVLKRGTMFPMRASRLFELYRNYDSLETIPQADRSKIERDIFRAPIESIWQQTQMFWRDRDPQQLVRADAEPKHRMALVFRWYLGMSSRWANAGEPDRRADYQIWCGPAMGAFNEWTKGNHLEQPENRRVAAVARQLLAGAAVQTRIHMLQVQAVRVPPMAARITPRVEWDTLGDS